MEKEPLYLARLKGGKVPASIVKSLTSLDDVKHCTFTPKIRASPEEGKKDDDDDNG